MPTSTCCMSPIPSAICAKSEVCLSVMFSYEKQYKKGDGHKKYGLGFLCYLLKRRRRLFFPHSGRLIYETATEQWKIIRPFFAEYFKKVINGFELAVFSLRSSAAAQA